MIDIIEHYYGVIRWRDGTETETQPFRDYDSCRKATEEFIATYPRGRAFPAESFCVEKRFDVDM